MITACETKWWDRSVSDWEVVPAGVAVRILVESELLAFVSFGEAHDLRDCLRRSKKAGEDVVFALRDGEVAVWPRADLVVDAAFAA